MWMLVQAAGGSPLKHDSSKELNYMLSNRTESFALGKDIDPLETHMPCSIPQTFPEHKG